ncbi:hypothetical protein JCM8097_002671 [Rhodosporidiobolus ruineniae]
MSELSRSIDYGKAQYFGPMDSQKSVLWGGEWSIGEVEYTPPPGGPGKIRDFLQAHSSRFRREDVIGGFELVQGDLTLYRVEDHHDGNYTAKEINAPVAAEDAGPPYREQQEQRRQQQFPPPPHQQPQYIGHNAPHIHISHSAPSALGSSTAPFFSPSGSTASPSYSTHTYTYTSPHYDARRDTRNFAPPAFPRSFTTSTLPSSTSSTQSHPNLAPPHQLNPHADVFRPTLTLDSSRSPSSPSPGSSADGTSFHT